MPHAVQLIKDVVSNTVLTMAIASATAFSWMVTSDAARAWSHQLNSPRLRRDNSCMEMTASQFAQIEHCLSTQGGNVRLSNLQVLNAILFVAEHGCKWRGLPKCFGNWHTIYTHMNRWSKAGVFEQLQQSQVVRIKIEAVSLDSASIKVHPDGTGALKKRPAVLRQIARRLEHQDLSGCRGCSHGSDVLALTRTGA